jgi:hypothetical protein
MKREVNVALIIGIFITIACIIILILDIKVGIVGTYQYDKQYQSYWDLSDKSSTIAKKSEYIDKFVSAIKLGKFENQYDAIYLTTPNNSFNSNFEALLTLQQRLHEISKMDVSSFQYQIAIQQITEQEQGEAYNMLNVFSGIWWKTNHTMLYSWIGYIQVIVVIIFLIIGIIIWSNSYDYY